MRKTFARLGALVSGIALLTACQLQSAPDSADTAALLEEVRGLRQEVQRQRSIEEVRYIAHAYGHYMDNALYEQVLDLFSPNIESCEISGYGVYEGFEGCRRIWMEIMGPYYGGAENEIEFGWLVKHYLVKDLISISEDGNTAHARFDYFSFGGIFGNNDRTRHQIGIYDLDFVREDGIWRISKFFLTFNAINYNQRDWATNPQMRCPSTTVPPDGPSTFYYPFPEAAVLPFFDNHPVTGEPVPSYINPQRYWQGNWPGEFGGPCGVRPDADASMNAPTGINSSATRAETD